VFRSLGAGLGLVAAAFFLYDPITDTVELGLRKAEIQEAENILVTQKHSKIKSKLQDKENELQTTRDTLTKQNDSLKSQLEDATRKSTDLLADRQKEESRIKQFQKDNEELRQQLANIGKLSEKKLKELQQKAADQSTALSKQLSTVSAEKDKLNQNLLSLQKARVEAQKRGDQLKGIPEMVNIPGGKFQMGCVSGKRCPSNENPVHQVTIASFKLGKYEVTFEEYDVFVKATNRAVPGDTHGRGKRPVKNVSWGDAGAYAKWLSKQTGQPFRLPTESEWEYAARSGGKEDEWAGTSNEKELGDFAWYTENSDEQAQEVGKKKANGLGLHDMSGNVWEWVEDCWHKNYQGAPEDGSAWLEAGGGNCGLRRVRGGAWNNSPGNLRASFRNWNTAVNRYDFLGFRLAQGTR